MKRGVRKNWKVLVICLFIVYAVAFVGSMITYKNANVEWYNSTKTALTPPNFVFMIVWNILFFLIAFSLFFSWTNAKKKQKMKIGLVFGINFVLNMLWSILFFEFKRPDLAFFELIALWASIVSMIYATWKIDKKSAYLLVPYLLWVSFAGVLNYIVAFM